MFRNIVLTVAQKQIAVKFCCTFLQCNAQCHVAYTRYCRADQTKKKSNVAFTQKFNRVDNKIKYERFQQK
jgi:hypothetical protein